MIHVGNDHANYYPAFINHITNKFHGVRVGTFAQSESWEKQFYDAIMAHPAGELPAATLCAALEQWSCCEDWKPKAPLSGAITENNSVAIEEAEKALLVWLWPMKISKAKRKKENRGQRKRTAAAESLAACAVQYAEENSLEFVAGELEAALPHISDEEMEEEEEEESVQAPSFAFGYIPMR